MNSNSTGHAMNNSDDQADKIVSDGVEPEEFGINQPFNPSEIRIETQQMSLDTLIKRIKEKEIDLSPDFQRNEVWKPSSKSRLIESLLIRIPLPAFYVDATDEDRWVVIDGLQRLSTLRDFILGKSVEGNTDYMKLEDLEFLNDCKNMTFKELPRNFQRRIEETQVTVYKIERGTPPEVKFNIFKRINTGGLPLSSQEIRHALNQGAIIPMLKEMAESEEFRRAVNNGIKEKDRMADRECVLRFFAFVHTEPEHYNDRIKDFDNFLSEAMTDLNKLTDQERLRLKERFLRSMEIASRLFGQKAFRKQTRTSSFGFPINKSLFESWSVNLDALTDPQVQILVDRKEMLQEKFLDVMADREFSDSISQGTGSKARVKLRFRRIKEIIQEVLNANTADVKKL
ncbi:MAG: DUF262 domain-containing protein [Magnetococcales bacterium]|nr:DUF262 domain-containing protein [Magnetococcales bacterium]